MERAPDKPQAFMTFGSGGQVTNLENSACFNVIQVLLNRRWFELLCFKVLLRCEKPCLVGSVLVKCTSISE